MAFAFSHRQHVGLQVKKLAREQLRSAIEQVEQRGDFDETVHQLRRRCKKLRGLLRLVRPNFPGFDNENAVIRDAADGLSVVRDAAVMLDTFDVLVADDVQDLGVDVRRNLRGFLEANVRRVSAAQDRDGLLQTFSAHMSAASVRVEDWKLDGDGFALVAPGLADTYGRMCRHLERADRDGEPEVFHDWRKHTKYHRFHIGLLKEGAPDVLGARRDQLDTLGEYLGDHHNLFVLEETLRRLWGPLESSVTALLARRQRTLEARALNLGRQLCVDSPEDLVGRLEKFWKLLPKEV